MCLYTCAYVFYISGSLVATCCLLLYWRLTCDIGRVMECPKKNKNKKNISATGDIGTMGQSHDLPFFHWSALKIIISLSVILFTIFWGCIKHKCLPQRLGWRLSKTYLFLTLCASQQCKQPHGSTCSIKYFIKSTNTIEECRLHSYGPPIMNSYHTRPRQSS